MRGRKKLARLAGLLICATQLVAKAEAHATAQPQPAEPPAVAGPQEPGRTPLSQDERFGRLAAIQWAGRSVTEEELAALCERRRAVLVADIDAQADLPARVLAAVRAAEYILGRQIEPSASRLVLGLGGDADRSALRAQAEAAAAILSTAESLVPQARLPIDDDLLDRLRAARAYAAFFEAMAAPMTTSAPAERLLDAALKLAPLLDDPGKDVAASARFWQAHAYRLAGRPERTLQLLPRALAAPRSLPYDFLSRLERCRALAAQGQHSTALGMVPLMRRETAAWLRGSAPFGRHALTLLEHQLLLDWAAHLEAAGDAETARNARADAEGLILSDEVLEAGVMRLGAAVGGLDAPWSDGRAVATRPTSAAGDTAPD